MFTRVSSLLSSQYGKRLIMSALLLFAIAIFFWTQSRIPALSDKAMMGGSILLEDPLSFEAEYPVNPSDSLWTRIGLTTINWIFTNMNGMLFGVFFGAAFLTMLRYLPKRGFKNGFANTVLGLFIGAPLGVCVNCAAPIARGIYSGGARLETALAVMITSPTFNVIVLTMMISLFPLYMVVIKLALSLVVILVAIPIICRLIPADELQLKDEAVCSVLTNPESDRNTNENLAIAMMGFIKNFLGALWYIVRITVPMMFLAGFLGAAMATMLPVSMIQSIPFNFLTVLGIVAIGLFLPVPIAFDIILAMSLLATGAPVGFVMALLFTLGIYSIYSYSVIAGTISFRAASWLAVVIFVLGIGSAYMAKAYEEWEIEQTLDALSNSISFNLNPISNAAAADLTAPPRSIDTPQGKITITSKAFEPRSPAGKTLFTRSEAWHRGIDRPNLFNIADMTIPFQMFQGSVSAADLDNDGDQDVVMGDIHGGIRLFQNDGTGQFSEVALDLPKIAEMPVFYAAPADINNDGWIDLVITTFARGEYLLLNNGGNFSGQPLKRIANRDDARHVVSLAFGDINKDGFLDTVFGNHSGLRFSVAKGEYDRNRIVFNNHGKLTGKQFLDTPGQPGETLSVLISDFNHDGMPDLIEGNDFAEPDIFYLGDGTGKLKKITAADKIIPRTTLTTMSVKTADLDNDLKMEIYLSQIAGRTGATKRLSLRSWDEYCSEIERPEDRKRCNNNVDIRQWYVPGTMRFNRKMVNNCEKFKIIEQHRACISLLHRNLAFRVKDPEVCKKIPPDQMNIRLMCQYLTATKPLAGHKRLPKQGVKKIHISEEDLAGEIPQFFGGNVLLVDSGKGTYTDQAEAANLQIGGWSWDVKIYDFDNDGLQDIHILNGDWILRDVTPSKLFMRNRGGLKFENKTREYGLEDYLNITGSAAADYDNDGDIDQIAQGVNGPVIAYWNNSQDGNSIVFEYRDFIGNRFGIGNKLIIHYGEGNKYKQMRELKLSGGYSAFDAPLIHFGLGDNSGSINRIEIEWSTGGKSTIDGPFPVNARYSIQRDSTK